MAVTQLDPGTIWLGGPRTEVGDLACSEAIAPGHLIERFNNAGVIRFRKHSTTSKAGSIYATEQSMLNRSVNGCYAASDLIEATVGAQGTTIWAWIASGQNIAAGDTLESAGDGTLKIHSAGVQIATALENRNNTTGSLAPTTLPSACAAGAARIRIEVL